MLGRQPACAPKWCMLAQCWVACFSLSVPPLPYLSCREMRDTPAIFLKVECRRHWIPITLMTPTQKPNQGPIRHGSHHLMEVVKLIISIRNTMAAIQQPHVGHLVEANGQRKGITHRLLNCHVIACCIGINVAFFCIIGEVTTW